MIGRASLTSTRQFWSISLPQLQGSSGMYVTKYKIVKPGRDGSIYDDYLIALPDREQMAKLNKEMPVFIRYLQTITEAEGRQEEFKEFVTRCKNGLQVETDMYVTTDELLAIMWKNGYSDEERATLQATFPVEQKFHYPELSALFDIPEEDTYKFCYRTRVEKSHIGELDEGKLKRQGLIRDHWLMFGLGAYLFKCYPTYNYYFVVKGFGTAMWLYTNWVLANRWIYKSLARNEYMAKQKTAQGVMEGESKIMEAMARFGNDSNAVNYLKAFKGEAQTKLTDYRQSILNAQKAQVSNRAAKQLQSISNYEGQMANQLQEMMVQETGAAFKSMAQDDDVQRAFLKASIAALSGGKMENDPITREFASAMQQLEGADLMTVIGNPNGSIVERVAAAQQSREHEFQKSFMVTQAEAQEVRELANQASSGGDYDFSKLSEDAQSRLEGLYKSINEKVGFYTPAISTKSIPSTGDSAAQQYIAGVNSEIEASNKALQHERLSVFCKAF